MPIDLRVLPAKTLPPKLPKNKRWIFFIFITVALTGGSSAYFISDKYSMYSLWYLCCAIVFPFLLALTIYGFRLRLYENERDYVFSWNQNHEQIRERLITHGQCPIAILAASYVTPLGCNHIAKALLKGNASLMHVCLPVENITMRLSQLSPSAKYYNKDEYKSRLITQFKKLIPSIEDELIYYAQILPIKMRIKHNAILQNEDVLSIWHNLATKTAFIKDVEFAQEDDGLLWIDQWLDTQDNSNLILSIEINMYAEPLSDVAESVSALLLAPNEVQNKNNLNPLAFIHRPVQITNISESVADALTWGRVLDKTSSFFIWQSQFPSSLIKDVMIALDRMAMPIYEERVHRLDDSLGMPGYAVGNITMIIAAENARFSEKAQFLLLKDGTPQCCVIQAVQGDK